MRKNQHVGFTLIELLVVITIIAVLAAILFPVFASAREKARQTGCLSNLKQLGLAFSSYSNDYDEQWVKGAKQSGSFRGMGWAGVISPYVKSIDVFVCPDDQTKIVTPNPATDVISYAYNQSLVIFVANSYSGTPALSEFLAPSRTVSLLEVRNAGWDPVKDSAGYTLPTQGSATASGIDNGTGNVNVAGYPAVPGTKPLYATGYLGGAAAHNSFISYLEAQGRHSDGSNYAFLDGHVKWLRSDVISPGLSAKNPSILAHLPCETSPYNAAGTDTTKYQATFSPK